MAEDPGKTPGTPVKQAAPQMIPLAKIHDLPGVFIPKQPDRSYGGMVSSIQASGVKEAVILRLREDGEYQLVTGYRRRRGSELAQKRDIPAYVYEMTLQEAVDYHRRVQNQPDLPIPGKLVSPTVEKKVEQSAPAAATDPKEQTTEGKTRARTDSKATDAPKEPAPAKEVSAPKEVKEGQAAPAAELSPKEKTTGEKAEAKADGKTADAPKELIPVKGTPSPKKDKEGQAAPAAGPNSKEKTPEEKAEAKTGGKTADAPKEPAPGKDTPAPKKSKEEQATPAAGSNSKEKTPEEKAEAKTGGKATDTLKESVPTKETPAPKEGKEGQAAPATGSNSKEKTPEEKAEAKADGKTADAPKEPTPAKETPAPKKDKEGQAAPAAGSTPKEKAVEEKTKAKPVVAGPAAKGPAGTQITQVFQDRLEPPDEKALKDLPSPKEGESYFIVLHPGYLEKSKFNTVSVDQSSEDYRELKKSIELNGVKDPVLTRINPEGGLEILSGQRRHMIASELNYPVPAIIQKIDDADAKILVSDGNLHRPKISTYDLSRTLRMKMEGMKQKAGRKKKGAPTAEELNSDEKLAQEMGMSVSKLNRILRLSEASKEVCDRVDDGSLALSIASAVSFLRPENQDELLHLSDLGYKVSTERVEYLKKVEKAGKLNESTMRSVLEGKNVLEAAKAAPVPPAAPSQPEAKPSPEPPLPPSPDVPPKVEQTAGQTPSAAPTAPTAPPPVTPSPERSPQAEQNPPPAPTQEGPAREPERAKEQENEPFKGEQGRPEYTKVILAGDRLRKYFPDVSMTPREIEESIYDALEERRQRLEKQKQKENLFKKSGPSR
ncbi:ParB/RepB/Spo0J family partition protein [uncultured Intestinimonas sp.]|uniref:ParB/RepB/Spo0J family partition protein n=1 Tax=uncultured Intestinimonas sp. TaxID=1689265 RepID=UPI002600652C|nr:ParB N-terminal domain-containing protein [uncultured Intestinimonas sp.]